MTKMRMVLAALGLVLFMLPTQAGYAVEEAGEEIKLHLGEIKVLPVNNPKRIAIGNPEVLDIASVTKNEIAINPKAAGVTNLIFWDNYGEQSYRVKVFSENVQELKHRIDNLLGKLNLPNVYTQAEEEEEKVILLGKVKNPQEREKIALVLGPLKAKTIDLINIKEEETAVEIDVQVLELDKDASKTLGLTWPSSINLTERSSPGILPAGTKFSTLFKVLNLERATGATADPFTFKLDALIEEGRAKVLSRPRLACQSGKEAELLVGGEKPVFSSQIASAGGAGASVEYKEYGIKLKIKPTVNEENRIKVSLNVEISETGDAESIGSTATGTTTAKAYPLSKRNVSTELYLDDGQTLAIGGLIKQREDETVTKVPFLGDMPVFGAAFRRRVTKTGGGVGGRGNTELFITLTPRLVKALDSSEPQAQKKQIVSPAQQEASNAEIDMLYARDQNLSEPLKKYVAIVQRKILDNMSYPPTAKQAGFQGTVKLSLHLSYTGQLMDAVVKESSGYRALDDYAVDTARRVISFPPFPTNVDDKDMWIDVPVVYRLN